jgi:pimeloyl-ACP methyl ester carboxylesterase
MRAHANGLEFEYETYGEGEPLLLVNGFSVQLTRWPPGLVEALVAAGFRVVAFDNRDVGLSSKLDSEGVPRMDQVATGEVAAPYGLTDMADDAAALIEALGLGAAHVVGMSMGGMIAQQVAIRHPASVRTMTSVMSTTSAGDLPIPEPSAAAVLAQPARATPEQRIEQSIEAGRVLWGDSPFPFDEVEARRDATTAEQRCFHPAGVARQMQAIITTADRTQALGKLDMPCLVMHGTVDPIFAVAHGEATANAIPDAHLEVFDGMGHSLPAPLWRRYAAVLAARAALA